LIDSYNDAVNRRDADAWAATWHVDAEWDLMGQLIKSRDAIVGGWQHAIADFSYIGFTATPGSIEVNGDQATARVYVRETLIQAEDKPENDGKQNRRDIQGLYLDELLRVDGTWLFSKRAYSILFES